MDQLALVHFEQYLIKKNITWTKLDAGDRKAGSIQLVKRPAKPSEPSNYKMDVNKNHDPNVQFSTLAHLFLGHIGRDTYLRIPLRAPLTHKQRELEAESTAFIVCARNGVECKSQSYLASYVKQDTTTEQLDLYQIMRAAGQVETILGLAAHTKLDRPVSALNKSIEAVVKTDDFSEKQNAAKAKMAGAAAKLAALIGKKIRVQAPQANEKVTIVGNDNSTLPLFPEYDQKPITPAAM